MVGLAGFELATSCSQSRRSTKLSYSPFLNYLLFILSYKHGTAGGTRTHTSVKKPDLKSGAYRQFRHRGMKLSTKLIKLKSRPTVLPLRQGESSVRMIRKGGSQTLLSATVASITQGNAFSACLALSWCNNFLRHQ